MNKPSVFEYLDVLIFLREHFAFRKSQDAGFSYESWAAELKFQSRSYVRMILLGKKKVSDNFGEYFASAVEMSPKEREYFLILIRYSQAAKLEERQAYGDKLLQILRTVSVRTVIDPAVQFYSSTLYSRLLTLLGFRDVKKTVESLADLLVVDPSMVLQALELLGHLGLASSHEEHGLQYWGTSLVKYTVPAQVGSADLMKYHENSLSEAIQAFPQKKETRFYKSLILPLSEEELERFKELFETFSAEQLTRFQSPFLQERRLFQVNMNYYAVSKTFALDRDSEPVNF